MSVRLTNFSERRVSEERGFHLVIPSVPIKRDCQAAREELKTRTQKVARELRELKTDIESVNTDWANICVSVCNGLRMIGKKETSPELLPGFKEVIKEIFASPCLTCKQKSVLQNSIRNICQKYPGLNSIFSEIHMQIDYRYPELIVLPTPASGLLPQHMGFENEMSLPLFLMSDGDNFAPEHRSATDQAIKTKAEIIDENTSLIADTTANPTLATRHPYDDGRPPATDTSIKQDPDIPEESFLFGTELVSKKMSSAQNISKYLQVIDFLSVFVPQKIDTDLTHDHIHIGFDSRLHETLKAGTGDGFEAFRERLYILTKNTAPVINNLLLNIANDNKIKERCVLYLHTLRIFMQNYTENFPQLNCVSDMPDGLNWETFEGYSPKARRENYIRKALTQDDTFLARFSATPSVYMPGHTKCQNSDYVLQHRRFNPLNIQNLRCYINALNSAHIPTLEIRNLEYCHQENMNVSSDVTKAQLKYILELVNITVQEVINEAKGIVEDLTPRREQAVTTYQHDMTLAAFHTGLTQFSENDYAVDLLDKCFKENPKHREDLQYPSNPYPMLNLLTQDDFGKIIADAGENNPIVLYRLQQMDDNAKDALRTHLGTMNGDGQFDKWIAALNCGNNQEFTQTMGRLGIFS